MLVDVLRAELGALEELAARTGDPALAAAADEFRAALSRVEQHPELPPASS